MPKTEEDFLKVFFLWIKNFINKYLMRS